MTVTVAWATTAMVFNSLTGTNYGYLNHKPDTGSFLDLLGPWPWYLPAEVALILAAWALITWPWARRSSGRRRRHSP